MAIFLGLVGYFMERYGFPLTPFVLGIILGPIAEVGLSKSLMILDNSFFAIYLRPISGLLGLLTILSLLYPYIRNYFLRKGEMKKAA
jgi:putative tricarboxylic transport membrane protein